MVSIHQTTKEEVEEDADTVEVVDGHHRKQIAEELGIECPEMERSFEDDTDRENYALTVNLVRRHLGPISWAEAFERLLKVRNARVGSGKGDPTGKAETVSALAEEQGVTPRRARQLVQLRQELEASPRISEMVDIHPEDKDNGLSERMAKMIVKNDSELAAAIEAAEREETGLVSRPSVRCGRHLQCLAHQ